MKKGSVNKNGFSLIEIIVVLALLTLAMTVVIPALPGFYSKIKFEDFSRVVSGDLRNAQQLTVSEQVYYCVQFFPDQREYKVLKCESREIILERSLPAEVLNITTTGLSDNEVKFNPYGAVSQSGQIILEGGFADKIIKVEPSGFIRIQ
jgi:prepilin-type N-terminal cleavage/methylation domain-containing protein